MKQWGYSKEGTLRNRRRGKGEETRSRGKEMKWYGKENEKLGKEYREKNSKIL